MRKPEVFLRAGGLAVMATGLGLALCACGSGDKPAAGAGGASHKAARHPVTTAGEEDIHEMVAAVSSSKSGPPVELKFTLPTRPEVGQVMDLNVAVVPTAPVPDNLRASFQVSDGLDVVGGSQLELVDKLVEGAPIRHVVRILPKKDGIFAVTAVVTFTASDHEWSRTFSIPVIAGEGLREQVAKGP